MGGEGGESTVARIQGSRVNKRASKSIILKLLEISKGKK